MAYQIPPPPFNDDPNVRAWLFELWKRNQDLVDNDSTVTLTGDVTGGPTAFINGAVSVSTSINLPNVTVIDGGAADTNYAAQSQGPYGVGGGGGGSALTVQDNSTSLTTAGTLLNFVGFTVTEPTADEITIILGAAGATTSTFTPGYPNYTYQSDSTFTVDLFDATPLFYVSRRVRFSQGGTDTHGVVSIAPDFNSSHANDTFVTLTMEGGDTIPSTGTFEVTLVTDAANWAVIAQDPFSGGVIKDVCTGIISAVSWWCAVGENGKVAMSSNAGITWTLYDNSDHGTAVNLNCCCFDPQYNKFWIGGDSGVLLSTTNSTSFTLDTTSVPAIGAGAGADHIHGIASTDSGANPGTLIYFENTSGTVEAMASTVDDGANWVLKDASNSFYMGHDGQFNAIINADSSKGPLIYFASPNSTILRSYASAIATTDVNAGSSSTSKSCIAFYSPLPGLTSVVAGNINNNVTGITTWLGDDTTTWANNVLCFAFSPSQDRLVAVGVNGFIGYWDVANRATNNGWTLVSNGFSNSTNINAIDWSPTDGVFVAVAANGQIARSSTGVS